ncbi:ABC transporter permease [Micromonospora haikouensis]|uniref:Antibiotic ABC transporter permease n=1 Tax=Micromonospora haikouensis TaxID=686309 RepID=A0A0D0W0N0_9ACTN|nr:ABC-2 family transporter protein [Micromonospora haikouensis]KIR66373.1 antibiotic ABC transporter permease [Micromonospora haikouensis]
MRPYRAMARIAWRNALAYRVPFLMSLSMLVFNLVAMFALWRALLGDGNSLAGFTWPQMKAYLLVSFFTNCLVSTFTDFAMASRIRSGAVAVDLVKPVDYQKGRFAEALGFALLETVAAATVCAVVLVAFGGVPLPPPGRLALFVASLAAVVPLKFLIVYMCGLLCFWTQNYLGISLARVAVSGILSGATVPLAFFPAWLRHVAEVLPFQAVTNTPAMLFLGRSPGLPGALAVAVQLLWVVALWWLARRLWHVAVRRLTVHGG